MKLRFFVILLFVPVLLMAAEGVPMQLRVGQVIGTFGLIPTDAPSLLHNTKTAPNTSMQEIVAVCLPLLELLPRYQILVQNMQQEEMTKIQEEYPTINMVAPVAGFLSLASEHMLNKFSTIYAESMEHMREMQQDTDLAKAVTGINVVIDLVRVNVLSNGQLPAHFFASTENLEKFNEHLALYVAYFQKRSAIKDSAPNTPKLAPQACTPTAP